MIDKYFPDTKTALDRLSGGLIRHSEKFFYCTDQVIIQNNSIKICTVCLETGNKTYIDVNEIDLTSINDVPLGYVNLPNGVTYVTRNTVRSSKQGLHASMLSGGLSKQDMCTMYMYDCLNNTYPSLKEALKFIRATGFSIAFNKYFCLKRVIGHSSVSVHYEDNFLGFIKDETKLEMDTSTFNIYEHSRLFNKQLGAIGLTPVVKA